MKKCKYCGKEFESTPVYCVRCGASEDFLVKVPNNKKTSDYEDLANSFLDEDLKKKRYERMLREYQDKQSKEEEEEYYQFLKEKLGEDELKVGPPSQYRDEYYDKLELMLDKPLHSTEETTFNGIFTEDDTIENTFFKKQEKKQRGVTKNKVKKKKTSKKTPKVSDNDTEEIELTTRTKKAVKTRKKLWKTLFVLVALLSLLVVLLVTVINSTVGKNQNSSNLPTDDVAMSFFSQIKGMDESTFLSNPKVLIFPESMDPTSDENQERLKTLFELVHGNDYSIKGVKKIEQKGTGRAQVTYDVTGDSLAAKVFASLLFKESRTGAYYVDFADFIQRYDRIKNTGNAVLE